MKWSMSIWVFLALYYGSDAATLDVKSGTIDNASSSLEETSSPANHHHNHHFDFLMFTQIWPITSCLTWEDRRSENTCSIDDSARLWTIHGIWPTSNHKIGPLFCNRTDKFDPEKIRPLLPELRSKWTDVRVGGDEFNFWKHEWEKHGTCAEQLPSMANEYLYFTKALELHKKYNVTALLGDKVTPGSEYGPANVVVELAKALHQLDGGGEDILPAVNCAHDKNFDAPLFYEIYICLDKEFNRIGCENTKGGTYGSCGKSRPFLYPDTIHPNWARNAFVMIMFPVLSVLCFPLACAVVYMLFGKRRGTRSGYVRIDAAQ